MPPAAAPVAEGELRPLDPYIWKACAGFAVKIPTVSSRVYYFPQGHSEQSSSTPDFSGVNCIKPYFLCRVIAINFLANPDTDEVFVKFTLDPRILPVTSPENSSLEELDDGGGVLAFAKILTPSDANNGGGFSVPRFCADSIFPPLDFKSDTPAQNLTIIDLLGKPWNFRHIYRGTPRRHLLTTGWSKFVNEKKLVAGDSVVFIKYRTGEIFVGIRRRSCSSAQMINLERNVGNVEGEGFVRNGRGRIRAESVVEAVRLAEMDRAFEVEYYPMGGSPEFVVGEDLVVAAMGVGWMAGMRVKMAVETDDSSRTTWYHGMVSASSAQYGGSWARSPWRMLQVTWDEPEIMKNLRSVSPWQVELVPVTNVIESSFLATKKLRVSQNPELFSGGQGNMFFPLTGFGGTMTGSLTPSLLDYTTSPAGMQGARQDPSCAFNSHNPSNNHHLYCENLYGSSIQQKLTDTSTDLSAVSTSQCESSSPLSQVSIQQHHGTELSSNAIYNPTKKASSVSFQLFGRIIHTNQPLDADADADREHKEAEGAAQSVDSSSTLATEAITPTALTSSVRVSAVEACSLSKRR